MSDGGQIANYRTGNRAEWLGIGLFKCICAVAQVPREEDFGLFDAVATLLRRSGPLLYPEDSFLVQFKSRTVPDISYEGERFQALLNQELAMFVAKVDLTEARIDLFSLAPILSHPNITSGDSLVLKFGGGSESFNPTSRQAFLTKPALTWTTADTENRDFQADAYRVLKKWLELDRQNRLQRAMGLQIQIRWESGKEPEPVGTVAISGPDANSQALRGIVPAIQFLLFQASQHHELLDPALQIAEWLRHHGVDPDVGGIMSSMAIHAKARKQAADIWRRNPDADLALALVPNAIGPEMLSFWLMPELGVSKKYSGTLEELREQGFLIETDPETNSASSLTLGSKWLEQRGLKLIGEQDGVFLLKRLAPNPG
jgi:hypothetical protein